MNIKCSVIIPAYNTEEYIDTMLECVINQTYKNLEIIIINDGSTDKTLDHIKVFEKLDSRIQVFDIPNGGVSNARNIGIQNSTGEKLFFWDSDDVIELDCIEKCVNYCLYENVNAVLYGYSGRINGINTNPHPFKLNGKYFDKDVMTRLIPHFIGHSFVDINNWISGSCGLRDGKEHTALWRIMCDAQVIKENKIAFKNNLSLGEDTIFINTYFLYEKSVGCCDECFYHLTHRDSGANMTSNTNPELMMNNKMKLIEARRSLGQIARKDGFEMDVYWEGTIVFSAVQLCLLFAKKKKFFEGWTLWQKYMKSSDVKKTIEKFSPVLGVKAFPFLLLKWKKVKILYCCFKLMPQAIINKVL